MRKSVHLHKVKGSLPSSGTGNWITSAWFLKPSKPIKTPVSCHVTDDSLHWKSFIVTDDFHGKVYPLESSLLYILAFIEHRLLVEMIKAYIFVSSFNWCFVLVATYNSIFHYHSTFFCVSIVRLLIHGNTCKLILCDGRITFLLGYCSISYSIKERREGF